MNPTNKDRLVPTLAVLLVSLFAAGCATILTGAHFDETADFGKIRSFSWIDEDPHIDASVRSGLAISPLTHAKIQDAIRKGLQERGYAFVEERGEADVVIAYTIGTRQEVSISSYPDPYYGPWGWHVSGSNYYINEVTTHSYTTGTLGVDVFDNETKKPVWHGWAEKTITMGDREDPTPTITTGVTKMLESFPPGSP